MDYWGMSHGNSYPSFVKSEYAEDRGRRRGYFCWHVMSWSSLLFLLLGTISVVRCPKHCFAGVAFITFFGKLHPDSRIWLCRAHTDLSAEHGTWALLTAVYKCCFQRWHWKCAAEGRDLDFKKMQLETLQALGETSVHQQGQQPVPGTASILSLIQTC